MSGASPIAPSLGELRRVEAEAFAVGGPVGASVLICIRALCLPSEALDIDLDRIDYRNGRIEVPARGGRSRILSLPNDAMRVILDVAGSAGGSGQAVTAGRGPRLVQSQLRLDRLHDALADAAPGGASLGGWNFHGVRAAGAVALAKAGVPAPHVDAALGRWDRGRVPRETRAEWALAALERWCALLGPRPGGSATPRRARR